MSVPINPAHRLLLEDNSSFLLLEDNTSKIILDEQIALDDPLNAGTVSTVTPGLTFVGQAPPLPLRLQSTSGVNTTFASSVSSTAFSNALTPGSIILVAWEGDGVTGTNFANTPTDTAGNVYTRVLSKNVAATFDLEIWYALNTHATTSNVVTITDTGAGIDSILVAEEWSGITGVSPVDTSVSSSGSSTALSSGAATTTIAQDLLWVAGVAAISGNHLSAGAGYSNLTQNSTTFSNLGVVSVNTNQAGSYTGTMTVSSSVSWAAALVALKSSDNLTYEVEVDTVNTFDSQAIGSATVIDSYSEAHQSSVFQCYTGNFLGISQSFLNPSSVKLDSAKFYLEKVGTITGNANAKLYAHSGTFGTSSIPSGVALAVSDNFDMSTLTTSFQLITFTFSGANRITLSAGTNYVITVEGVGTNISNYMGVGVAGTTPTAAGNLADLLGASWSASASFDTCFYVYGVSTAPLLDKTSDQDIGFVDDTTTALGDDRLLLEDNVSYLLLEDNTSKLAINYDYPSSDYLTYTVPAATLSNGVTYYWRARQKVQNGGSYTSWSEIRSFTVSSGVSITITQLAGTVTASGGTQTIATVNNVSIAQVAASVTASGGTQLAQTNSSNVQVAATVTATGGTESIATVNIVSITQVAGVVTASGGTQVIATVNNVAIAQVAATVTASGGTQTIATINNVAISQLAGAVTASGGSQGVNSIQDATVTQLAGTVTATGGIQSVVTLQTVAITQIAANVTATGGTQVVQSNSLVTQAGATVTASGGTQTIATINNVSISQVAGSVTASGGTQSITTSNFVSIAQTAANVTATGNTQAVGTMNFSTVSQSAATVTASGGTQSLTAQIDAAIAQLAANVTATGGVQGIFAGGASSGAVTQLAANVTASGGTQVISTSTGPLPPTKPKNIILLTDGRLAAKLSNNMYMPL